MPDHQAETISIDEDPQRTVLSVLESIVLSKTASLKELNPILEQILHVIHYTSKDEYVDDIYLL